MIKSFEGRLLFYFISAIFFGWLFYALLSGHDPQTPQFGTVGRMRLAERMLNIMSPSSWGWFIFVVLFGLGVVGDWHYHRFKNLSEK